MPSQMVKGFQGNVNKYYQNRSLGMWLVIYIQSQVRENNFRKQGCIGESGFDPVELWVMGPPCGLKVGRAETSGVIM